jgi:hypothetical protein
MQSVATSGNADVWRGAAACPKKRNGARERQGMTEAPDDIRAAQSVRRLMRLVTVLTVVMIGGLLLVVGLLAARLMAPAVPVLPESIALPDGARARAVTTGEGWVLVLTDRDEVLVFDDLGTLRQTVRVGP